MDIDLSFSQAAVVMPVEHTTVRFIVVGAGGTGSFVVPAIARLIYELKHQQNKYAELLIVDPDIVETGNINIPLDIPQLVEIIGDQDGAKASFKVLVETNENVVISDFYK